MNGVDPLPHPDTRTPPGGSADRSGAGEATARPASASVDDQRSYYDAGSSQLLADYVFGNPRVEAAIRHVLTNLPRNARRVLDVGCGVGWSSWEIKRNRPAADVLGVDLSPAAVALAQRVFDAPGLAFHAGNAFDESRPLQGMFDAVVMIDVYEHVAKRLRAQAHRVLARLLAEHGVLLMTFPSTRHQEFLRQVHPEELQPVDEDVTREETEALARDVEGAVTLWRPVTIWRPDDYVHVIIARHGAPRSSGVVPRPPEPRSRRAERVRARLGARVTPEGALLPDRGGAVVAVLAPNRNAYSETFIRAHLERLPARVEGLIANWFPHQTADGRPLLETGIARRLGRAAVRRALGWKQSEFHERAFRSFLQSKRVDVVLAEYAPTGVAVMDACRRAGVPLVVHFHGFDAYERATLHADGAHYPKMFASAAAVIAVSRHMERRLLELGAPRERLFYNPCGADVEAIVPGRPDQAPPLFVAVGRFVEKKAPHLTLLAFAELARKRPDARLVMAGDGALLDACRQLAHALGVRDLVEFPGAIRHFQVAGLLAAARAFVQHSVTAPSGDSEGTPVTVIEASAAALPVIATVHGGIPDVILDGETGLLVEEGDVAGMTERMLRLADDSLLAARLGAAGRARVIEGFSMERSIAGLWEILSRAATLRHHGRSR